MFAGAAKNPYPSLHSGREEAGVYQRSISVSARLDSRGGCPPRVLLQLLDLSVGKGFQLFDDLLQPAATLGMILLRRQGPPLLGILLVESLDVTDLCLQQVDTVKDRFSSI